MLKGRWAGVVDTVGGDILATAIKSTKVWRMRCLLRQRHVGGSCSERFSLYPQRRESVGCQFR